MALDPVRGNSFGVTASTTLVSGKTERKMGVGDDLPSLAVGSDGISLIDALAGLGLVASRGEAKRLVKGGGARIDGVQILDEATHIAVGQAAIRISAGKKLHGVLNFS